MRGASGQGKATLSHARRRRRLWCAQGQSECAQARQVHQERECRSTRYEKAYSRGEEVPGRAQVLMPKVINVWPSNQDGALPTLLADGETQPRFPSGKPILGKRPRCGPSPVGLGVRRRGGLGLQRNKMRFEITWLFGFFFRIWNSSPLAVAFGPFVGPANARPALRMHQRADFHLGYREASAWGACAAGAKAFRSLL